MRGITLKIISGCNSPTRNIVESPDRRITARDNFESYGIRIERVSRIISSKDNCEGKE